MKLNVLYFAGLRERIGRASETIEAPATVTTVAQLRDWLVAQGEPWASAFGETTRLRAAVNQAMARDDTALADGAEVAFFPPVTGG
ncbi:MAG: molybdopterin converting factor subunit 1 [Burkholderiaceae bacterium]